MSKTGTVAAVFRYPVKSMLGEALDESLVTEEGIAGDRSWALRDEARGDFMTGKRVAALMSCSARYAQGGQQGEIPEIELADGRRIQADDPGASKLLSEALGRQVTLCPIDPAAREPAPPVDAQGFDQEAEMRAMLAREEGEPLPDFSKLPGELMAFAARERRPFVDAAPLLLLTRQSLATIARAAPDAKLDVRRFRPSLLVDAPDAGELPEEAWAGQRLAIGETVVTAQTTCARCVMTTFGFADLPQDPRVMRSLVKAAQGYLGVYALVERPGRIRVGDDVELLS